MNYIGLDCINTGELFVQEFKTKKEAVDIATKSWDALSDYDRSLRDSFYVIKSLDPNVKSKKHLDGDIVIAFKVMGNET